VSQPEVPPSHGPLITHAVGCLVWWPLAALACVVIFPSLGGVGIAAAGVGLLALRLAHLTWGAASSRLVAQRLRRSASRRAAARSPRAASTAWS
jgi:hypothetical protein